MIFKILGSEKAAVGTAAADIKTAYRGFILENSGSTDVFFDIAGKASTDSMCLKAGTVFPFALTADVISVIGAAAGEIKLLYVLGV